MRERRIVLADQRQDETLIVGAHTRLIETATAMVATRIAGGGAYRMSGICASAFPTGRRALLRASRSRRSPRRSPAASRCVAGPVEMEAVDVARFDDAAGIEEMHLVGVGDAGILFREFQRTWRGRRRTPRSQPFRTPKIGGGGDDHDLGDLLPRSRPHRLDVLKPARPCPWRFPRRAYCSAP